MNSAQVPERKSGSIATLDWKVIFQRKPLIWTIICLLVVAGLYGLWRYLYHPPQPWIVRWQVTRYLHKRGLSSNFKVDFPFPSKAEMAKAPAKTTDKPAMVKGSRTGRDFDSLAHEYIDLKLATLALEQDVPQAEANLKELQPRLEQITNQLAIAQAAGATNTSVLNAQARALRLRVDNLQKIAAKAPDLANKQTALEPIVADLWEFQKAWDEEERASGAVANSKLAQARSDFLSQIHQKVADGTSYSDIYRGIGQVLFVADPLLGSANPEHVRVGLSMALDATRLSLDQAMDNWLAARICEGYVWPHLDVATDQARRSPFNLENLLSQCGDVFAANMETNNVIRNYTFLVTMAKTPEEADAARMRLANICERRGDYDEAIQIYKTIISKAKTVQTADTARMRIARAFEQSGQLKDALQWYREVKMTNNNRWLATSISRLEVQLKKK